VGITTDYLAQWIGIFFLKLFIVVVVVVVMMMMKKRETCDNFDVLHLETWHLLPHNRTLFNLGTGHKVIVNTQVVV
jgi:hypothetical protein